MDLSPFLTSFLLKKTQLYFICISFFIFKKMQLCFTGPCLVICSDIRQSYLARLLTKVIQQSYLPKLSVEVIHQRLCQKLSVKVIHRTCLQKFLLYLKKMKLYFTGPCLVIHLAIYQGYPPKLFTKVSTKVISQGYLPKVMPKVIC